MYEGRHSAITNVTCYYWVCALALWQCVSFYQAIGGWFWNCLRITIIINTPRVSKCDITYFGLTWMYFYIFGHSLLHTVYLVKQPREVSHQSLRHNSLLEENEW